MNLFSALGNGSMPSGIDDSAGLVRPGGIAPPSPGDPLPTTAPGGMGAPVPPPPVVPSAGPSMAGPSAPGGPGAVPQGPDAQYQAITQSDGSVVLHLKGPGGSLGPAVKIIPPPKIIDPNA